MDETRRNENNNFEWEGQEGMDEQLRMKGIIKNKEKVEEWVDRKEREIHLRSGWNQGKEWMKKLGTDEKEQVIRGRKGEIR